MGETWEGIPRLACFELWGGNSREAHPIELPGLQGWVCCIPFGHAARGGDVHYISVCSKGRVSRIVLADVAGHGPSASAVAERLRHVFQQHTDSWDQSALMRELNESFQRDSKGVQFATAVVLGFYHATGELLFTNAGHLPLLWRHAKTGLWDWLEDATPDAKNVDGLPLGIIAGTDYSQTAVELDRGDLLLIYTDGVTETRNERGEDLGPRGLLALVQSLGPDLPQDPVAFGSALMAKLREFRGNGPQRDDETVLVLQRDIAVV